MTTILKTPKVPTFAGTQDDDPVEWKRQVVETLRLIQHEQILPTDTPQVAQEKVDRRRNLVMTTICSGLKDCALKWY